MIDINIILFEGSRIKTSLDFGLVTLDIGSIRASDVGIYTCKVVNLNGEATSTTSIKVHGEYNMVFLPEGQQCWAGCVIAKQTETVLFW